MISLDYSTGRVMNSISGMLPSSVQVVRDSVEQEILAQDLVLGDIVSFIFDFLCLLGLIQAMPVSGPASTWTKDPRRSKVHLRFFRLQE